LASRFDWPDLIIDQIKENSDKARITRRGSSREAIVIKGTAATNFIEVATNGHLNITSVYLMERVSLAEPGMYNHREIWGRGEGPLSINHNGVCFEIGESNPTQSPEYKDRKKTREEEEVDLLIETRFRAQMEERRKREGDGPVFLQLDEFRSNLPTRDGRKSLHITMVLQVTNSQVASQVKDSLPLIRDRVSKILSSHSTEQTSVAEMKNQLARRFLPAINSIFVPKLTGIYLLQQDTTTAELQNFERIGVIYPEAPGDIGTGTEERFKWAKEKASYAPSIITYLPVRGVFFTNLLMRSGQDALQ
jgi:hypothetical protein